MKSCVDRYERALLRAYVREQVRLEIAAEKAARAKARRPHLTYDDVAAAQQRHAVDPELTAVYDRNEQFFRAVYAN